MSIQATDRGDRRQRRVSVRYAYAEIAREKNPAHLPKRGEKVATFKTWGLSRFKVVKW